jgi:hypothetical protein
MAYVHMWRIEYQTKNDFPLDMEVEEIDAQIFDILKYFLDLLIVRYFQVVKFDKECGHVCRTSIYGKR